MSLRLPPVNSSPIVLKLRNLTQNIYTIAFESFPILQRLADTLYTETQLLSSNTTVKDDIAWARESLNNDSGQLVKIKQHIQFINAEETITSKKEILGVFNELTDFLDLILLDDLITTLKGVRSTLNVGDETYNVLKIKHSNLDQIIELLSKFKISFKLVASPLKNIKFTQHDLEESFLDLNEIQDIEKSVDDRFADLKVRLDDLQNIFE